MPPKYLSRLPSIGTENAPIVGYGRSSIRFVPDTSDIDATMQRLDQVMPRVMARVSKTTAEYARIILADVFVAAMDRLSYDQFAPEFRDKLLENLARIPIAATATPQFAAVELDLGFLGGKDDLEKAFHRHALLTDHRHIGPLEPYVGQDMVVKDADDRHRYFESILYGDVVFQAKDGRNIPIPPGLWEKTKQEYLAIWGEKSPQWLYLEYGQTLYEPQIPPANIVQTFRDEFAAVSTLVFENEMDRALAVAAPEERGIKKGSTGLPFAPAGTTTYIGGKPYRPGTFTPRSF